MVYGHVERMEENSWIKRGMSINVADSSGRDKSRRHEGGTQVKEVG